MTKRLGWRPGLAAHPRAERRRSFAPHEQRDRVSSFVKSRPTAKRRANKKTSETPAWSSHTTCSRPGNSSSTTETRPRSRSGPRHPKTRSAPNSSTPPARAPKPTTTERSPQPAVEQALHAVGLTVRRVRLPVGVALKLANGAADFERDRDHMPLPAFVADKFRPSSSVSPRGPQAQKRRRGSHGTVRALSHAGNCGPDGSGGSVHSVSPPLGVRAVSRYGGAEGVAVCPLVTDRRGRPSARALPARLPPPGPPVRCLSAF